MDGGQVESDFAFYVDVDLVPNPGLREALLKWVRDPQVGEIVRNGKGALVVPAFQQESSASKRPLPTTKSELYELYKRNDIDVFHGDNKAVHGQTDHDKWFEQGWDSLYGIQYKADSHVYEPYVLVGAATHGLLPRF